MRKWGWAAVGMLVAAAAPASAGNLYVFGDSLVDTGNVAAALSATGQPSQTPELYGYVGNRFSNGYNFADVLSFALGQGPSGAYGYPYDPAYLYGGNNFAYGGAQTRPDGIGTPNHPPSFSEQLALFATSGKKITASDTVLVTFGGNDIQQELFKKVANPGYTPDFTATNAALVSGLATLIGAGATNIVVTGEADVGKIPRITQYGSTALDLLGTSLSKQLSDAFKADTIAASQTGANVQFFDLFGFETGVLGNAAALGLTNTTAACLNPVTHQLANPTCQGYLYFDQIHPTTQVHQLIGDALGRQIGAIPEPATWAAMVLGFGLAGLAMRRRVAWSLGGVTAAVS